MERGDILTSPVSPQLRNLITDVSQHKLLVFAGPCVEETGELMLQTGSFSLRDFIQIFTDKEVRSWGHRRGPACPPGSCWCTGGAAGWRCRNERLLTFSGVSARSGRLVQPSVPQQPRRHVPRCGALGGRLAASWS